MAWANVRGCHSFTLSLWMWTYVGRVLCDLQLSAACPVQCVHLCLPVCAFLSLFILYVSVFFACRSIAYVWWVCDNPELRCNTTIPEKILGWVMLVCLGFWAQYLWVSRHIAPIYCLFFIPHNLSLDSCVLLLINLSWTHLATIEILTRYPRADCGRLVKIFAYSVINIVCVLYVLFVALRHVVSELFHVAWKDVFRHKFRLFFTECDPCFDIESEHHTLRFAYLLSQPCASDL